MWPDDAASHILSNTALTYQLLMDGSIPTIMDREITLPYQDILIDTKYMCVYMRVRGTYRSTERDVSGTYFMKMYVCNLCVYVYII